MKNNFLTVGVIVKPQGIKGEVKIKPFTNDLDNLLSLKEIFVQGNNLSVTHSRIAEGFVYMTFKGVDDRNKAEALRNKEILIPRNKEPLPEGEYYIVDLLGADIVINNAKIGTLKYIDNYGAADVYTIETLDKKEGRFPALKKTILSVDLDKNEIVLDKQNFENTVVFD